MISVDKIKENIKCPQFGDLNYGKWGAQKLEIREALKFMCDLYDSMDSIIKQQQERIDKAIEWVNNHIETYTQNGIGIIDWNYDADPRKLLEILKGEDK